MSPPTKTPMTTKNTPRTKKKPERKGVAAMRAKGDAELDKELRTLREEHYNLRFQRASGNAQGTARVGTVRRAIARILTLQRERVLASASQASRQAAGQAAGKESA